MLVQQDPRPAGQTDQDKSQTEVGDGLELDRDASLADLCCPVHAELLGPAVPLHCCLTLLTGKMLGNTQ